MTSVDEESTSCFAVVSYIRGVTEPFERVLAGHSVTVAQKTLKTLEVYLTKDPVLGENGPILFIPFLAKTASMYHERTQVLIGCK